MVVVYWKGVLLLILNFPFDFVGGLLAGVAITLLVIMFYSLIIAAAKNERELEKEYLDLSHNYHNDQ